MMVRGAYRELLTIKRVLRDPDLAKTDPGTAPA